MSEIPSTAPQPPGHCISCGSPAGAHLSWCPNLHTSTAPQPLLYHPSHQMHITNTGWLCPTCGRLPEPTLRPQERAGPYPMLTRDDVIRMAREAGFANVRGGLMDNGELSDYWDCWPHQLGRFAALVADFAAAAEREACAELCERVGDKDTECHAYDAAAAIRARGEESD